MKALILLIALSAPIFSFAQYAHQFSQPVPPNVNLLKVGDHTILIHPMDLKNEAQKWITYDSMLNIINTKKLVTPDAGNIMSQTYTETINSILRVDQFIIEGQLKISAFAFDLKGNLLFSKEIEAKPPPGHKIQPFPFYVLQSPDKRVLSLVQTLSMEGDSLAVSNIILDDQLNIFNNVGYTIPFDPRLADLYLPVVFDSKRCCYNSSR